MSAILDKILPIGLVIWILFVLIYSASEGIVIQVNNCDCMEASE
jgi:hypothetical protein